MKVAIDCRMLQKSGIGRFLQNLLPEILKEPEVSFVLLGNARELQPYAKDGVEIVGLKYGVYHPLQHLELFLKLPSCDVFFAPHFPTSFLPLRAKKRVTVIHDVFHISDQSNFGFLKKAYARFLYHIAVKRSDCLISVSETTLRELIKYTGLSPQNVHVIANYIDCNRFFVLPSEKREKRKKEILERLGIESDSEFLLFVGNIKPHKNILRMIRAFEKIGRENLYLLIVGDQKGFLHRLPELDRLVEKNKQVIFTGKLNDADLLTLYNTASLLVFPSLYEGFGYPPLEAMSCGTVTAASDIDVVREVCGEGVHYFDPYNENDMAEKIVELLDDKNLRASLRSKFEGILNRYDRDRHIDLYRQAIFGHFARKGESKS